LVRLSAVEALHELEAERRRPTEELASLEERLAALERLAQRE